MAIKYQNKVRLAKYIKEHNGVIIVQSPESAKFDGMPRNAISTGFADLIQKPDSIAKEMTHIARSMVDTSERFMLSDQDLMAQVFSIRTPPRPGT